MMQSLLSFGKSIREFKNTSNTPVFPQASIYPAFFDKHLVHPSRRIKALTNDPNANIRAFYFQYLMLCYEIQNQNYEFYISKIKKFLTDPNFTFLFLEQDDQNIFNDRQFKRFLLQFMEILDSGDFETTEAALNTYPIADIVLVYFFRSLAIYAEITSDFDSYIDKTNLFGFLLENFNIDAQIFEQKCIKFIEAEVFVYQESSTQVYLVYKDIQQSMSESNHSRTSQDKKSFDSMVDSKKQDKQEVQQNISMLEQQQNKSNDDSSCLQQDNGFKKNKILDNQAVYQKITDQFQQKPSVFSCNDDVGELDSHAEQNSQRIQYSFKASQHLPSNILNNSINSYKSVNNLNSSSAEYPQIKQTLQYESSIARPIKKVEYQGASLLTTHTTPLSDYGLIHHPESPNASNINTFSNLNNSNNISSKKSQYNFNGVDEYIFKTKTQQNKDAKDIKQNYQYKNESVTGLSSLITTNDTRDTKSHKFHTDQFLHPNIVQSEPINREKYTSSYLDSFTNSVVPPKTNSITQNHEPLSTPAKNITTNNYQSIIPHINTHLHPNPPQHFQQFSKPPPTPMHFEKLHIFSDLTKPFNQSHLTNFNHEQDQASSTQLNNNSQININVGSSKGYIPATRDIPTHDNYQFTNGAKASGMSGYTSSRQSLTIGLTNKQILPKQSETQSKTSLYFDSQAPFDQKQKYGLNLNQINKKSQQKLDPEITLYNPTKYKQPFKHNPELSSLQSYKIPQIQKRDLRQESISIKQKLKDMVTSKLSVSKEFTDSLTLLKMGQPYCSNIKKMKTRSREFRQSILNTII